MGYRIEIAELERIIKNYTSFFIIFDTIFFVMILVCVLLLIRFLKSKKNLQDSNEYLLYTIHGQEVERARIARELHDTVAQDLRWCRNLLEKKDACNNIAQVTELLGKTLMQVRMISYNLSPADITRKDLKANIVNLCNSMNEKSGIKFRISMPQETDTSFLSETEILNLYRVIQESFTNIIKHAHADEAVILIRNNTDNEDKGLYIFISDDGCGFNSEMEIHKVFSRGDEIKHFGLAGMKKRCQLIGAQFSISSMPGEGTQVSIFMPLRHDAAISLEWGQKNNGN